ncbi:hypothetical protein [Robertmurraya korlensis]|uniref:hypothetical protein n=1 Tax=Robertmurraya korlensis TaxID=519977 RepID=UPI000826B559|nr:hypothetical protein [Robertmurraya korlensis]
MLVSVLLVYYLLSIVYLVSMFLLKKRGLALQAIILLSCPLLSFFILYTIFKKRKETDALPEWLLRREQYDDKVLMSPNIQTETNVIPFNDALILNDNKTKRTMLIDLLKGQFQQNIDALELALQSDDSETSHYAATAVQHTKRELINQMRTIEAQLDEEEEDYSLLSIYRDTLKQYIRIEFLDAQTRKKYLYSYLQTLTKLIQLHPTHKDKNYIEKINTAITLDEHQLARETAEQFITYFPKDEDAYFYAMKVHFHMQNEFEFKQIMNQLRVTDINLSPSRLSQLRFWLQGESYEK